MADDVTIVIKDDAGNELQLSGDPPTFVPATGVYVLHVHADGVAGARAFNSVHRVAVHPGLTYAVVRHSEGAGIMCSHGRVLEVGACDDCDRCPSTHGHDGVFRRCRWLRDHEGSHAGIFEREHERETITWS